MLSRSRRVVAARGSRLCAVRLPISRRARSKVLPLVRSWHDEVEIKGTYQLQALDVPLPVADPIEYRRPPPAPDEEDRIAGEQSAMLSRVPQESRCPARMSRNGNDLEVLIELVTLGEGLIHMADFGYRPRIRLVDVKRRVEGLCNPVTGRRGLVMVVQVLARDAAEVGNGLYVLLEGGCPVDEQVARFALEQESADLQRGPNPKGSGTEACSLGMMVSMSGSPCSLRLPTPSPG